MHSRTKKNQCKTKKRKKKKNGGMQHGGDHWWVCIYLFIFYLFCFFKDKISVKQRYIQSSKHLKQGSVRFGEASIPDLLLQLLHHTGVGTLFTFRSPTSAPLVDCSGDAGRSTPVGLVGSGTGLHNPNCNHKF